MPISDLIETSPIAAVISEPGTRDNPIVACNAAFEALTGYARDEIIGRNCRFLAGPSTEAELTETLRTAIRNGRPAMVEILNYKKDGTPFRNAVLVAPIFDAAGRLEYYLGSQVEIAGEGAAETRRSAAAARIAALTPRQREVLIHIAAGKLNKQIAFDLGLSERTVKLHRSALFRALGVATASDAIRLAIEAGY